MDPRYQILCIKYAFQLKPFVKNEFHENIILKHCPALIGTLAHDFLINGTQYNEALEQVLRRWVFLFTFEKDSLPCTIFRLIGLPPIIAGQNPYIHTALQIFKSLTTGPILFGSGHGIHHPPPYHSGLSPFRTKPSVQHYENVHGGLLWLKPRNRLPLSEFVCQRKRNHINTGRIYRIQRELRLSKLQTGICHNSLELHIIYSWNYNLVSKFLIPVLDQCPRSHKLLARINQRIRHVLLRYTTRRRLEEAVDRYIQRTSDIGSN